MCSQKELFSMPDQDERLSWLIAPEDTSQTIQENKRRFFEDPIYDLYLEYGLSRDARRVPEQTLDELTLDVKYGREVFLNWFGADGEDLTQHEEIGFSRKIYFGIRALWEITDNPDALIENPMLAHVAEEGRQAVQMMRRRNRDHQVDVTLELLADMDDVGLFVRGIEAENILIEHFQSRFAGSLARTYLRLYPGVSESLNDLEEQDFIQFGKYLLTIATRFYDPEHESGGSYVTYIGDTIRKGMGRLVRESLRAAGVPQDVVIKIQGYHEIARELLEENGEIDEDLLRLRMYEREIFKFAGQRDQTIRKVHQKYLEDPDNPENQLAMRRILRSWYFEARMGLLRMGMNILNPIRLDDFRLVGEEEEREEDLFQHGLEEVHNITDNGDGGPQEAIESVDLKTLLEGIVAQLPWRQRAVIELFYFQGMPVDRVAHELGIDRKTVYMHRGKALRQLRHPGRFFAIALYAGMAKDVYALGPDNPNPNWKPR